MLEYTQSLAKSNLTTILCNQCDRALLFIMGPIGKEILKYQPIDQNQAEYQTHVLRKV